MTSSTSNHSLARWIAPLLVIFLGFIAYSNSLQGPFVLDDENAISKNPQILSLNPFKYASFGPTAIAGRPAVIFTFSADYAIAHLRVWIYHATNLLIHLLAGLMLYALVRFTLLQCPSFQNQNAKSATWLAVAVASLWIVHPLTTQSVTYIAQRSEALATLFLFTTLYCAARAATGHKFWAITAVIACALGMASKEIVYAAPILTILYDRAFLFGSFKESLRRRWKLYAALAATWVFILFSLHTGSRETMVGYHLGISPIAYARSELNVIARYLRLAFCPTDLVLDYYDWPSSINWSDIQPQGWLVLAIAVFTLIAQKFWPRFAFLGACFFLVLAPTSSFLPIKQEAAAEQRMYFPLAALICLLVVGIWLMLRRVQPMRWIAVMLVCASIILLTWLTQARNDQFASAVDIWQDTVTKRPYNTRAHNNLGQALAEFSLEYPPGSPNAVDASRAAAGQFQIVLNLEPDIVHAVFGLAQSLEHAGDPAAAEDVYTHAIPRYPDSAGDLYLDRGSLRARRNDWTGAKSDFLAALAAHPDHVEPHYFLGLLYEHLGDLKNAEAEFAKAVAISPKFKDAAQHLANLRTQLQHD